MVDELEFSECNKILFGFIVKKMARVDDVEQDFAGLEHVFANWRRVVKLKTRLDPAKRWIQRFDFRKMRKRSNRLNLGSSETSEEEMLERRTGSCLSM